MPEYPKLQFRPDDALLAAVAARSDGGTGANATARRDLERYYAILALDLRAVALTEGEAMLLADATNGTLFDAPSARLLWAEIADALPDGLAAKWQVDGPALVAKLRALSARQSLAVVDALERAWRHPDHAGGRAPAAARRRGQVTEAAPGPARARAAWRGAFQILHTPSDKAPAAQSAWWVAATALR